MNVIYGNNFIDCIWWGLETFAWGMYIAAIYMMTGNLWLVIGIHTAWDIVIRIPRYYMGTVVNETFSLMLSSAIDIISDIVLPVMAIVICVFCFKRNAED